MGTSLSKNVRSLPSVQRVLGQLSSARKKAREAEEESEGKLSPMETVMWVFAGAGLAAVGESFLKKETAQTLQTYGGMAGIAAGSATDQGWLVALSAGAAAPRVKDKVAELLTKSDDKKPAALADQERDRAPVDDRQPQYANDRR